MHDLFEVWNSDLSLQMRPQQWPYLHPREIMFDESIHFRLGVIEEHLALMLPMGLLQALTLYNQLQREQELRPSIFSL